MCARFGPASIHSRTHAIRYFDSRSTVKKVELNSICWDTVDDIAVLDDGVR